jgi:hypothetical protein
MAPRRGDSNAFQMRTVDPYQATRPFNVEAEPFDFATQGRDLDELLRAGAERKKQRWEAPEFNFKQSPEFKMDVDPVTQQVRQFKQGAAEDDPIFGLLGSGLESRGEDPVDWGVNTVKNWTKGKSPARVMGSIASSLPVEEIKAGLLAGKAALGAKGLTSIAGILPTSGFRQDILRLGNIANRRLNIDTPELERVMKLTEEASTPDLATKFLDRFGDPDAQAEIERISDLADLKAPEADITDEMARRMAIFGNARAPQRRGSFPGLGTPDTPTPTGGVHKTREEIAGGPVLDYGRFDLGGTINKRMGEGPGGKRMIEKGSGLGRDDFGTVVGRSEPPSYSAREEAQTKIMELLQGDTPVAHRIEGGGTMQRLLPESFEKWSYGDLSHIKNPEIANQLAAEQARDIFGAITDRHGGQFMFDPAAKKMVGVDKGFGALGEYGFRGRLMEPERIYGRYDPYASIAKGGQLEGLVDPDTYQRVAQLGLSIPEPEWRQVLDPLMGAEGIRAQSDKDTAMRNFMQSIQGMPAHLQRYYDRFVKP